MGKQLVTNKIAGEGDLKTPRDLGNAKSDCKNLRDGSASLSTARLSRNSH